MTDRRRRVKLSDEGRYSFVDPSPRASGTQRSVRPFSILIVEDDEAVAACIVAVLSDARHLCEHVPTLARARESLATTRPDVVTLDLELRDDDLPTEFLEEVLRRPDAPAVVIVSASRLTQQIAREHGLPFLQKPFPIVELTRIVEDAAERRRAR